MGVRVCVVCSAKNEVEVGRVDQDLLRPEALDQVCVETHTHTHTHTHNMDISLVRRAHSSVAE